MTLTENMQEEVGAHLIEETPLIVITGGPCSGKTTVMSFLREKLTDFGIDVYVACEAATFLMQQGIRLKEAIHLGRWSDVREYEAAILKFQLENESRLIQAAKRTRRPAVILCDRGIPDTLAYLEIGESETRMYAELLHELSTTEIGSADRYKAVIKLTTAAIGAEAFYSLESNAHRDESPEAARALDAAVEEAYLGHGHMRVVDNSTDFEKKKTRALQEVCRALGIPAPLEIERKYLVRRTPALEHFPVPCRSVNIEQAYLLKTDAGESRRIRRRTLNSASTYYLTRKRQVSPGVRIEIENQISWREYADLMRSRDPKRGIIQKRRTCFLWQGQYFELDHFINTGDDLALLEIELTEVGQRVTLPPFLGVSENDDVTDDPQYENYYIAGRLL